MSPLRRKPMLPEPAPAAEACLELGRRAAVPSVHAPIRLAAPGPASLMSFLIDATLAPGVLLAPCLPRSIA